MYMYRLLLLHVVIITFYPVFPCNIVNLIIIICEIEHPLIHDLHLMRSDINDMRACVDACRH